MLMPIAPDGFSCNFTTAAAAIAPEQESLFTELGAQIAVRHAHVISPLLNTVFTLSALSPVGSHPWVAVGATLPLRPFGYDRLDFPRAAIAGRAKLAVVSPGTTCQFSRETLCALDTAVTERGMTLVAVNACNAASLSTRAVVLEAAPLRKLLEHASLFVSAGGVNSVFDALSCGIAPIVIPHVHDQPLQAHLVESGELGASIDPDRVSLATMRVLVEKVTTSEQWRKVEPVRAALQENGAATCATLLQELYRGH
jgi:UDP:flavonoid glycosyltransferase YjiC (YdhE family)